MQQNKKGKCKGGKENKRAKHHVSKLVRMFTAETFVESGTLKRLFERKFMKLLKGGVKS